MPASYAEIGLGEFAGGVRFRRRFGYPSRIDPHEIVWLTFTGVEGRASILLNGQPLATAAESGEPLEFPITSLLRPRNELIVDIEASGAQSGLWGEVALEVRCTAYLRSVDVEWADDCLTVHGEVVGFAEGPLELYALVDGRTVVYSPVTAGPEGQPFRFVSEPIAATGQPLSNGPSTQGKPPSPAGGRGLGGGVVVLPRGDGYPSPQPPPPTGEGGPEGAANPHEIRVDLVSGAVVWYTWARTQDFR
jgi:hypothetical protein